MNEATEQLNSSEFKRDLDACTKLLDYYHEKGLQVIRDKAEALCIGFNAGTEHVRKEPARHSAGQGVELSLEQVGKIWDARMGASGWTEWHEFSANYKAGILSFAKALVSAVPTVYATKDRPPTAEDADNRGKVLAWWTDSESATWMRVDWDDGDFDRGMQPYWASMPPAPPQVSAEEEEQTALRHALAHAGLISLAEDNVKVLKFWEAAKAFARKEAK